MSMIFFQFVLAVILFLIVNWIGDHSSTFGYLRLTLYPRRSDSPAFNFFLKTLAPTVFVIIVATILYTCRLDRMVHDIWHVALYYFLFRVFFNIALGKGPLLDWISILIQMGIGTGASYLAYVHLILLRKPLFPDVESVGHELWIIIALFLYATFNNVRTSNKRTVRRKNDYLRSRFNDLSQRYGTLINGKFLEKYMELVAYAILIVETFNRPWLARLFERLVFPWGSRTLGPMQVRTTTRLTDAESVAIGIERLRQSFTATSEEIAGKPVDRYRALRMAITKYNRDEHYVSDVLEVLHILWAQVATDYRPEFEFMYRQEP